MGLFKYQTVLLVDDNYIDNLISKKMLEGSSYAKNILVTESAQEAIKIIKKSAPEGMSGFDFLQEIASIEGISGGQTKIYILTSSLDPSDLNEIRQNKLVSKVIAKPLSEKTLAEI
jgi:CheY-like chemotaxis protein